MVFHYMGKYNMDPESLPGGEHEPNAVAFREPKDSKSLGLIASGIENLLNALHGHAAEGLFCCN